MSRLRSIAYGVLLGGPLYLLLIDTVSAPELYAGAGAVLVAAGVYEMSYSQGFHDAAFRPVWIGAVLGAIGEVPRGIAIVTRAIVAQTLRPRAQRGCVRSSHFPAGDEHNRYDLGHRALTEALGSLAPHAFVIGIDPERDELLVHELR